MQLLLLLAGCIAATAAACSSARRWPALLTQRSCVARWRRRPTLLAASDDPQQATKLAALDREEQLMRVGGANQPLWRSAAYLLSSWRVQTACCIVLVFVQLDVRFTVLPTATARSIAWRPHAQTTAYTSAACPRAGGSRAAAPVCGD